MILVGFVSGGSFCLIGIMAHEDYGSKHLSKIIGYLMTGAAVGILIFEVLILDVLYPHFATGSMTNESMKSYGKWNFYIFLTCLISAVSAVMMSFGAYLKTRKTDGNMDKAAEFVNL
eukprot:CAMPEP_0202970672 /NCGR_PEP_ID=MMETSP1396-20130829/19212_1 /ASSEMBLY_ACC=CAM_ASM_000872 /TAXON_ID= /ORGANISM="Pseudokeronopsis sp., Strain Brazil" /LENGTH=116 /DNA_ID=CAMNT_0049699345 /DNA_START=1194 /DNA_END=1544 /DNA_ORIENTATION=+